MQFVRRLHPVLLGLVMAAAACVAPPQSQPAPTAAAPKPSTPTVIAPAILVNGVKRADLDLCAAIRDVTPGSTITIRGDRSAPIDLARQPSTAATKGRCKVTTFSRDVTIRTEGDPLVLGQMTLSQTHGWLIDGLNMTPSSGHDHQPLLIFVGGEDWRLTNCELYGSASMAELNVGHWYGAVPVGFEVDHCYIHDNPGSAANADNQNDNAYIFTADGVDAKGHIHDNVFVGAPRGFNVKIGGTGLRPDEGSDGITFEHNTLVNNGARGTSLLIATDSDDVAVRNNVFVGQGDRKLVNVQFGSFEGSDIELTDNLFWGYDPTLWPEPRPILWSFDGDFDSVDLNESTSYMTQRGSIRFDPRYPSLGTWHPDPARFPAVVRNGVTYGARR